MQKMQMSVQPQIVTTMPKSSMTELILIIKGSPISEVFNLERWLDSIEQNVLTNINWKLKEEGEIYYWQGIDNYIFISNRYWSLINYII